ncbi:hypothetical protein LSH36_224g03026 [Paralvinella palmiformis]|uniref:Transmembrane protein 231 n=1 Tax=Paralvinella palmiformis TaxID=53620 RepID=A0AAD9N5B1_9ANNE|nr:hypothetical protein LSH36_224g03026 [Paralvinella palmiformis]
MAVYEVYTHPELRRYKTHIFSKATVFQLICIALTWIPPLLIGLRSQGFWQRVDNFIEQPEIHFKHQLMLELQTSLDGDYIMWSTFANLNNLQMDHLRVPVVKSREEDVNHDGLKDLLHIQIEVPLMDSEQVYSLKLLLIFDYILEESIINQTSIFAKDFEWSQILASYSARNLSTVLTGSYPIWMSGRGAGKPFVVNATIRYPVEYRILYPLFSMYYPGFWQLIKFGWVQYSTLLIVFWFILQRIKVFVFSNQLIPTIVERPFKEKTN